MGSGLLESIQAGIGPARAPGGSQHSALPHSLTHSLAAQVVSSSVSVLASSSYVLLLYDSRNPDGGRCERQP